ncbi:hypothetical protein BDZ89DRAFT_310108 [Hymenopellis radicata]|nr:hypothetical protein BDZ89DRAFT_310108 [Hymenopellis radicata]
MNGIDDAATDAFSFMQNAMSIMNNDIPDDDGSSFGATVLVPGDVSTTSVAPTTTLVESVTPPPPPPTTTDELPAPTASDNSFGHLIRRSYADMSDVTDGALAHATISDCPIDGSALSTLVSFSEPAILEKARGAAVVWDLRKRNPSLLPNLALNLPRLEGRQTQPCVNCSVSEYNTLYCGAAFLELSIEVMYS